MTIIQTYRYSIVVQTPDGKLWLRPMPKGWRE